MGSLFCHCVECYSYPWMDRMLIGVYLRCWMSIFQSMTLELSLILEAVAHGAFQTGVQSTGWDIEKVPKAMWRLFKDSPARREIYIRECGSSVFLMKFCQTRWIEDDSVAERAIELWPNIVKVIKYYQEQAPSYRPKNNKSYDTFVAHHTNQFIEARFTFFKYVASILKVYLVQF